MNGWTEREHPNWGKGGIEESALDVVSSGMLPTKQWVKGESSIIPPCEVTFNMYELFPVDGGTMRFDTLEEAIAYADGL